MRALVVGAAITALLIFATAAGGEEPPPVLETKVVTVESTYQGKTVHWWARRAVQARKDANARALTIHRLKQAWRPTVDDAIMLASIVYGVSSWEMHRVASCESGHNPMARNGPYRGVYQEGPMFERGPFARLGVFNPFANVFTAAWTVSRQGWRQWSCKP